MKHFRQEWDMKAHMSIKISNLKSIYRKEERDVTVKWYFCSKKTLEDNGNFWEDVAGIFGSYNEFEDFFREAWKVDENIHPYIDRSEWKVKIIAFVTKKRNTHEEYMTKTNSYYAQKQDENFF